TAYGQRAAAHMYNTIQRGWAMMRQSAITPVPAQVKGVKLRWDPGRSVLTSTSEPDSTIDINGGDSLAVYGPDEWDDWPVLHEYGHVMSFWNHFDTNATGE